ncbi:hypothetical protein OG921_09570 [Aldersonia sp. NBC_00410]|uniref:hypothetical protein n=1 Tax=Aldersonia sp. NBC_00410 TaxID=2975954 RepID=UPI00225249E8|nr:hypothetical protein [Aldersonia sp. NBC_00410]MCX5043419.1 hypothetical protein [Aldersonia sp. NBC_00410]
MSTDQGATASTPEADSERAKRKRRAFLAVGLVVGLGVGATLAVFSTNVFGKATFATGDWEAQGAFAASGGGDWQTAYIDSAAAGTFDFPLDPSETNIVPGKPIYSSVGLRVNPEKDEYPGLASLLAGVTRAPEVATKPESAELFGALQFWPKLIATKTVPFGAPPTPSCTEADWTGGQDAFGITGWSPLTTAGGATLDLPIDDTTGQVVCFAVTLPDTPENLANPALRGSAAGVTWQFSILANIP